MPITLIDDDRFEQACSVCGRARSLAFRDVSIPHDEQAGATTLQLPVCPRCRSVEVLVTGAGGPTATRSRVRQQQLLVDALAARCGGAELGAELAAEVAAVFPDGLRMDAPGTEAAAQ